jgi:hypothetical protein
MAAPQSPGNPQAGPDDEPLYLSAIDLGGRGVIGYFAVVAVAVLTDIVRGDGVVFRSWSGFALQAFGALVLGTIAARSTLTTWQRAGNRFTPANITSASLFIGAALAAGTLAGGFFPDALGYRRRAPEFFLRTVTALVPMGVAMYLVLRAAGSRPQPAPVVPQEPSLTGDARDAALRALELLDRGEDVVNRFRQQLVSTGVVTSADAERMWTALDGPGYVALLRQMPPDHAVREALLAATVAQTDAAYLIAMARGAHDAMGHTADSAAEFVKEVATRRGRPGADAETLAELARHETRVHRDIAAGLLSASRFSSPAARV